MYYYYLSTFSLRIINVYLECEIKLNFKISIAMILKVLGALVLLAAIRSKPGLQVFFVSSSLPRNDWSMLDLAELEEEWKIGDDAEDWRTPDDHLFHLLERERQLAFNKMQTLMGDKTGSGGKRNEKALERAALDVQHAGKAVMIFAQLRNDSAPKDGWSFDSMAAVCDDWSVSALV